MKKHLREKQKVSVIAMPEKPTFLSSLKDTFIIILKA